MDDAAACKLDAQLESEAEVGIKLCDGAELAVTRDMFRVSEVSENVHSEKYAPTVVEPSFGIGRILYALLEHSLWERVDDEQRVVLSLPPRVAPYPVAVLPINNQLNGVADRHQRERAPLQQKEPNPILLVFDYESYEHGAKMDNYAEEQHNQIQAIGHCKPFEHAYGSGDIEADSDKELRGEDAANAGTDTARTSTEGTDTKVVRTTSCCATRPR